MRQYKIYFRDEHLMTGGAETFCKGTSEEFHPDSGEWLAYELISTARDMREIISEIERREFRLYGERAFTITFCRIP